MAPGTSHVIALLVIKENSAKMVKVNCTVEMKIMENFISPYTKLKIHSGFVT